MAEKVLYLKDPEPGSVYYLLSPQEVDRALAEDEAFCIRLPHSRRDKDKPLIAVILGLEKEDRNIPAYQIMADVFSEDVLTNWSEMSLDEKSAKLNEYYIRAGENLGIDTKGVIIEPMPCETPGMISFGYNSGDGYIHLNSDVVDDPTQLGQVLDTATHEMRHQFQNDALAAPYNFSDIPQDVLNVWDYEMKHYINPDYDYQGYYEQAIECDARDFSEDVLNAYMGKMNLS